MPSEPRKKFPLEHHLDREDLAGEQPVGDLLQIIFFFIFFTFWVVDSFWLHWSTAYSQIVPLFLRLLIGLLLFGFFIYIETTGLKVVFNEIRVPPSVITSGLFRWSRHPIYLGVLFFYLALAIMTFSGLSFLLIFLAFWLYRWLSLYEERLLLKKFGVAYEFYMATTARWFGIPK
jgi:protein-S-isoprenylcysteine O-methyltransferase Ste14